MFRQILFCLVVISAAAAATPSAVGQGAGEVKDLIERLKDKDETVRLKAAKELGKLKEKAKDAIPALTITANKDEDEDVRVAAKRSLEAIRDAVGVRANQDKIKELLNPLIVDLKGKNAEKRIAALDKLADLGTQAIDAGPAVVEFGILKSAPALREAATATHEKIDPDHAQANYCPLASMVVMNETKSKQSLAWRHLGAKANRECRR